MNQIKNRNRTVDLTPTWVGVLPIYLAVLANENASIQTQADARGELTRMAKLADRAQGNQGLVALLTQAESFIAGFEDDDAQVGIQKLLEDIRSAIRIGGGS